MSWRLCWHHHTVEPNDSPFWHRSCDTTDVRLTQKIEEEEGEKSVGTEALGMDRDGKGKGASRK